MFDLTSSKLLILAVVALIVVGPKELPGLLRTVGRYLAMIRRHANEFRAQFEDAMRETELAEIRKDIEKLGRETQETLGEAGRSLDSQMAEIDRSVQDATRIEAGASAGSEAPGNAGGETIERAELPPPEAAMGEALPPAVAPVPAKPREATAMVEAGSGGRGEG